MYRGPGGVATRKYTNEYFKEEIVKGLSPHKGVPLVQGPQTEVCNLIQVNRGFGMNKIIQKYANQQKPQLTSFFKSGNSINKIIKVINKDK